MESLWAPSVFLEEKSHPAQQRFEGNRVRDVLAAFGMLNQVGELVSDFSRRWGEKYKWLTFESFHRLYPTFPVMIEAQSFFRTSGADNPILNMGSLFRQFKDSFVFKRYLLLLDRYRKASEGKLPFVPRIPADSCDLPLAMVFNCDGVHQGLVIHNGGESPIIHRDAFRSTFDYSDDELGPKRVWIEQFRSWLDRLARKGWQPNTLAKQDHPPEIGSDPIAIQVYPWMLKRCGGPVASTLLYAWLWQTEHMELTTEVLMRRRVFDDGVWLYFAQQWVAKQLSLSPAQVKYALASLKRKNLVEACQRSLNKKFMKATYVRIKKCD